MNRKYSNYMKKKFRIMIVKMIKNIENKMEKKCKNKLKT